ncbi:MAG: DUF1573 domain-containing protein [Polyangiaceae bacterium]
MGLGAASCRKEPSGVKPEASAGVTAAPVLAVDAEEHHFGALLHAASQTHTFRLSNRGNAPLLLGEVSAGCACTELSLSAREVAPGGSAELVVRYRAIGSTGPDLQRIVVPSNDPARPELTLTVAAEVMPDLRFEPNALALQADVRAKRRASARLEGLAVSRVNLSLAELRGDAKQVAALRVSVSAPPYDEKNRPSVTAELVDASVVEGSVLALINSGVPDPVQFQLGIEWKAAKDLKR